MDEKEKRLLEEIEASCQETEIPEGLKPEEMEKRLEAVSEEMRKETKHTGLIGKYAVVAAASHPCGGTCRYRDLEAESGDEDRRPGERAGKGVNRRTGRSESVC